MARLNHPRSLMEFTRWSSASRARAQMRFGDGLCPLEASSASLHLHAYARAAPRLTSVVDSLLCRGGVGKCSAALVFGSRDVALPEQRAFGSREGLVQAAFVSRGVEHPLSCL